MGRASGLNKYVRFERKTAGDDFTGQPATWEEIGHAYAAVEPLTGRERTELQQVRADLSHKVRLRWQQSLGLSPADRIIMGDRILEIDSVVNVGERNQWAELTAVEQHG